MAYFPMGQDDNQKFPTAVINYINTTYNPNDEKYFFCYMYEETSTRLKYYIQLWNKTSTGKYYITPNVNGYQFTVGFTNAITGSVFQSLHYVFADERIVPATPSGTFPSKFNPANSSKYDTSVSYLSNLKIYTQDGSQLMLDLPDEISPDGQNFEISNCWTHGTWLSDTQPQVSRIYYRNFRAKLVSGNFALYPISGISDGKLKMGIKNNAEFYDMEYSSDGVNWTPTETFPYEYFLRKRTNELGEFDYALTFSNTYIPVFADETTATSYINGQTDISEATNWNEISGGYPLHNGTGDAESSTTFGEVFTRAMFSQLYLCTVDGLYEISNALFDYDVTTLSGIWEDIKKGLEMYGTDPMQVVQGLRYYPFDLSTIFTNTSSQQYIYFGAYQLTMQNSVKKIIYCNGSLDLGTIYIDRTFDDWRDFEPYTKLSVYLPYVGIFPLDAKKYYNKTVDIKYFIDLRTGACTACLIADGVLLDWFDGIIGTEMPITLTDYSSYAQSQLNIIMRNAGLGIASEGMAGNIAAKGMKATMGYNENANAVEDAALAGNPLGSSLSAQTASSYGKQAMVAAGVGGAALLGTVAVGTGMKTAFDLMRTGTAAHTKTRPASSAMINQYLPQYAFFRFEILEIDESPYLNALYGRPTNESGLIMNFDGYLECEDVSLICPIATDNERQEIIDLLKAGIYITPP